MQVPVHVPGGPTGRAAQLPGGAAHGAQGPSFSPNLHTAGSAGAAAAAMGGDPTQVPVQHPMAYNAALAALDPRNSYLASAASAHVTVPAAAPPPRPPQPPPMPPGLPATPAALSTFGAAAATAAAALQPGTTPFAALHSAPSTSLQQAWRPDHQLLTPTASLGSTTVPGPAPPPGNPPGALSQSWSLSADALKALPDGVPAPVIKLPPPGARRLPDPDIAAWCRRLEANRVALAVLEHEHAATEVKLQEATLLVRRAEELRCMTNPVWQYLDDTDEQICGPFSLMQLAHVLRAVPQTQIESIETGESVPFVEAMARTPLREAVVARNALREELAAAEARVCARLAEVRYGTAAVGGMPAGVVSAFVVRACCVLRGCACAGGRDDVVQGHVTHTGVRACLTIRPASVSLRPSPCAKGSAVARATACASMRTAIRCPYTAVLSCCRAPALPSRAERWCWPSVRLSSVLLPSSWGSRRGRGRTTLRWRRRWRRAATPWPQRRG